MEMREHYHLEHISIPVSEIVHHVAK